MISGCVECTGGKTGIERTGTIPFVRESTKLNRIGRDRTTYVKGHGMFFGDKPLTGFNTSNVRPVSDVVVWRKEVRRERKSTQTNALAWL